MKRTFYTSGEITLQLTRQTNGTVLTSAAFHSEHVECIISYEQARVHAPPPYSTSDVSIEKIALNNDAIFELEGGDEATNILIVARKGSDIYPLLSANVLRQLTDQIIDQITQEARYDYAG